MKAFLAKAGDKSATGFAKLMAKLGCISGCHAPEAPEELFK